MPNITDRSLTQKTMLQMEKSMNPTLRNIAATIRASACGQSDSYVLNVEMTDKEFDTYLLATRSNKIQPLDFLASER